MTNTISFTAPRVEISDYEKEWEELPEYERKSAFDDLYGRKDDTPETAELLRACLTDMQRELDVIPASKKQSYLRAVERCPTYVNDPSFRLQFVRADFYDAAKAAARFVKYWKAKEFCFGPDKTFHPLSLNDMTEDDLATLKNQGYMALPRRDEAGRAITFSCRQKYVFNDRKNVLRLLFYLVDAALEDVTVQRNGFVTILYEDGAFDLAKFDRKLDRLMLDYTNNVWPVRMMGFHMCFDSKFQELVLPFGLYMMGSQLRARFRLHPGSRRHDRLEDFESYGVKVGCLPGIMGGNLDFEVEDYLKSRREIEQGREEREG